jgi:hydrogenase maturation protease
MTHWDPLEERPRLESIRTPWGDLGPGSRVRIRPRGGADILDLVLEGKTATVAAIELDYEDRVHLAVTVDDDPGRDFGAEGKPAHRFFLGLDEVEPLDDGDRSEERITASRILIGGIGNIFLGDDGFGVAVARRLAARPLPEGVCVVDFGIRGLDLAYALLDDYQAAILVDAARRGGRPGTLYVIEPTSAGSEGPEDLDPMIATHGMDPVKVLRLASALGGRVERVLLVGCEPSAPDPAGDAEPEAMLDLSEPVSRAVDEAVRIVEALVTDLRGGAAATAGSRTAPTLARER